MDPLRSTILLLHGASVVRDVICEILQDAGYVVRSTGDLGVAVQMMRESPPDLLIVGVYLGNISGHDAAIYLSQKRRKMQVLVLSGLPNDPRVILWNNLEKFHVFPEPFPRAALLEKVGAILQQEPAPPKLHSS